MKKYRVQEGTKVVPEPYKITILADGPYLVSGKPPVKQLFIMPNAEGYSWTYKAGKEFSVTEPVALCRCGASKNAPFCDGSHVHHDWDPALTAPVDTAMIEGSEAIEGPRITLTDNDKYCAFARFCDAYGRVWNLAQVDDLRARDHTIYEANHCPAGRLSAWDPKTGKPFEPEWPLMLGLVEDPAIRSSAGIFVIGGIPLATADGETYQVRNRMALCRCGQSSNKPFCDGTHASFKWKDGIEGEPSGEEF